MERVVLDRAFHGAGVAHETGAMERLDGVLVGDAGRDEFPATGKTGHQMRSMNPSVMWRSAET